MRTTTPFATNHRAAPAMLLLGCIGLIACTTPGPGTATTATGAFAAQPEQILSQSLQSEPTAPPEVAAAAAEPDQPMQPVLLRDVQTRVSIPAGASSELLGPQGVAALEQLLVELSAWSSIKRIAITGHTDSEGSDASNERFSLQRATAVAARLKSLGIDTRVEFVIAGEGEQKPVADNSSIAGRALNRRIEIAADGQIDVAPETLPTQPQDLLQAANQ